MQASTCQPLQHRWLESCCFYVPRTAPTNQFTTGSAHHGRAEESGEEIVAAVIVLLNLLGGGANRLERRGGGRQSLLDEEDLQKTTKHEHVSTVLWSIAAVLGGCSSGIYT